MTRHNAGEKTKPRSRSKISMEVPPALYSDFRQLLREQLEDDLKSHTGVSRFKAEYLLSEFESKLLDTSLSGVTDQQRHDRAIRKWLNREDTNREVNQRIMFADEQDFLFLDGRGFPVSAVDVIAWCKTAATSLLGESIPWNKLKGSFSGGASTSVKRGIGNIPRKYQEGTNITGDAIWHYLSLTRRSVGLPRDFVEVPGNVMFTVPKTSMIDRVACKEPELNMYCQKAVGDFIRQRLRRNGIDLNDQTVNQVLAREGSIDGSLATVDLSSASDSVTISLVQAILPLEWSMLLMELRSPNTWVPAHTAEDGSSIAAHWHINEMISSMGNAFTFELESLLFWLLVRACAYFTRTSGRISVYGDDIICPSGLRDSVESTLEFFGFTLNPSKSFWDGSFRESCGKHWFNGAEVTPFYVKRVPSRLSDWCLLLNHLRQWSASSHGICDPTYYPLWALFAEYIPKPLWGASDFSARDALVAPNIRNIARILLKQEENEQFGKRYQSGAYLQWLDTTERRTLSGTVETSHFVDPTRASEMIVRQVHFDRYLGMPQFPQEI